MPQSTIFMDLLQWMGNLYHVVVCVVVVIGIRLLWARHLKGSQAGVAAQAEKAARKDRRGKATTPAASAAPAPPQKKNLTLEIIDTLLIALILVFGIVRPLLLETFFIPSQSMEQTLLVSDKLIANKFVYHFRTPERGQVIVFQPPDEAIIGNNPALITRIWLQENPGKMTLDELNLLRDTLVKVLPEFKLESGALQYGGKMHTDADLLALLPPVAQQDFIKRVIGQPGDHVRIADGRVYVNGVKQYEPYVDAMVGTVPPSFPDPGPRPTLKLVTDSSGQPGVTFNGDIIGWLMHWYSFTHLQARVLATMKNGEIIVPPNAVLAMGDNRPNSFDSRYWGVVPLKNIKARAVATFWPLNRLKIL